MSLPGVDTKVRSTGGFTRFRLTADSERLRETKKKVKKIKKSVDRTDPAGLQ
jgi:hypothetical protein